MLGVQVPITFDGEMPGIELSFEFGQRREASFDYGGEFWDKRGVGIVPEQTKMRCQALLKLLQQALLPTSCLLQDLLFPLLEIVARIQRRHVLFEAGEEPLHGLFQGLPLTGL